MRYFYRKNNTNGSVEVRKCQEHAYHPNDLFPANHPHAGKSKIGPWPLPIIKQPDEIEFDHALIEVEVEQHFPGNAAALARIDRSGRLREAAVKSHSDDEIVRLIAAGLLDLKDVPDYSDISARRTLRGMPDLQLTAK